MRASTERIHDVSTSIEANVPETATRVLVLYRVSNGFARSAGPTSRIGRASTRVSTCRSVSRCRS